MTTESKFLVTEAQVDELHDELCRVIKHAYLEGARAAKENDLGFEDGFDCDNAYIVNEILRANGLR